MKIKITLNFSHTGYKGESLDGSYTGEYKSWEDLKKTIEFMEENYNFDSEKEQDV